MFFLHDYRKITITRNADEQSHNKSLAYISVLLLHNATKGFVDYILVGKSSYARVFFENLQLTGSVVKYLQNVTIM